jgi:hypothetical protein
MLAAIQSPEKANIIKGINQSTDDNIKGIMNPFSSPAVTVKLITKPPALMNMPHSR